MRIRAWIIELLAGLAGGIVAALIGGLLGSISSGNQGMASLAGSVVGMMLAFPLGVGLGMGFIAYRVRHYKRPWLGVVGSVLGALLILLLAEPTGLNRNTTLLLVVISISCILSAWIALHLPDVQRKKRR